MLLPINMRGVSEANNTMDSELSMFWYVLSNTRLQARRQIPIATYTPHEYEFSCCG
jgi:hypothetical protein